MSGHFGQSLGESLDAHCQPLSVMMQQNKLPCSQKVAIIVCVPWWQEAVRGGRADGGETWEAEWQNVVQPIFAALNQPPVASPKGD